MEKMENWQKFSAIAGFHIAGIRPDKSLEEPSIRQILRPKDKVRYFPDGIFREPGDNGNPLMIFIPVRPLDECDRPGKCYPLPIFLLDLDKNQAAELKEKYAVSPSSLEKFSLVPTGEENAEEEIEIFLPD